MFDWIGDHSTQLNAIANYTMVAIWIVYFQLLFAAYRRQRRSKLLINRGTEGGFDARCLISNMSAEPVFVVMVIASIDLDDDTKRAALADLPREETGKGVATNRLRQGPLQQGEVADIGSFSEILQEVTPQVGGTPDYSRHDFSELELTVIAIYGPEDLLVAGKRRFYPTGEGSVADMIPRTASTRQVRSRRKRRHLNTLVAQINRETRDRRQENMKSGAQQAEETTR